MGKYERDRWAREHPVWYVIISGAGFGTMWFALGAAFGVALWDAVLASLLMGVTLGLSIGVVVVIGRKLQRGPMKTIEEPLSRPPKRPGEP